MNSNELLALLSFRFENLKLKIFRRILQFLKIKVQSFCLYVTCFKQFSPDPSHIPGDPNMGRKLRSGTYDLHEHCIGRNLFFFFSEFTSSTLLQWRVTLFHLWLLLALARIRCFPCWQFVYVALIVISYLNATVTITKCVTSICYELK